MRVLIVDTCYEAFLSEHYARNPGLAARGYDEQWRSLMDTFFGTSDAYSHYLGRLGHTAHEVVVDCAPMQAAWARQRGHDGADRESTLLAQVAEFEPDVVYLQNLHVLSDETMRALRRPGRLIAGQIASAAPPVERLRMYDVIFTSFPHFVERFRTAGIDTEYFRIAFDERVLAELGEVHVEHETVFVGALNGLRHRRGNRVLAAAAKRVPIDFWGYDLRGWAPWSPIRRRYRGESWGLDMYRLLASSRTVLNRHISDAGDHANNMRLYEATGVGSLLVTDAKLNLAELFEPGSEVVTYRDSDELVERVRHYLANEDERHSIAVAGHARTLRDHTYAVRMAELAPMLEARL